ncbi:hypothetical protein GALMADRAFT_1316863 [Galerina marginata CBS 339.88]|uniref:Protein kinase domain-containing protein n=1 Tax=Galerina marginata (strain CBS 339.88) TaxID=685588 RepID=A0A067T7L4_GALM3|nr:hypothetical protein GALMADRAFT_1316863 [Galerina marginata CBS 339.88]
MIELLPALQVAAFALKTARDTLPTLQSHQERCKQLTERCQQLLIDVCAQLKVGSSPELQRQLRVVEKGCITVRDTVMKLSDKGAVWRMLNKENINRAFIAAEAELSDAFLAFNVGAHVTQSRLQNELAVALQNDRQHILKCLDNLLKRSQDMVETIEHQQPVIAVRNGSSSGGSREFPVENVLIEPDDAAALGSGTFGKALLGRLGGKAVVVKKLHPSIARLLAGHNVAKAFEKKAETWSKLSHPNVIKFLGASIESDQPFLVIDYCPSGNVLDYVQNFPQANRLSILHQASSGMAYLHSVSIIHGNLKISNLLVNEDHRVFISDYDLSWLTDDSGMSESTAAHAAWTYMAPEYLDGSELAHTVDVYSFAMTTWVLHTGCIPFSQVGWRKFRRRVVERRERPPYPESMHQSLWTSVENWWAPDPEERPSFSEIEAFLYKLVEPSEYSSV